jgi:hypothetical protein
MHRSRIHALIIAALLGLFLAAPAWSEARTYDLLGLVSVRIPAEFEVVNVDCFEGFQSKARRWDLQFTLTLIYEGQRGSIDINLYSFDKDPLPSALASSLTVDKREDDNSLERRLVALKKPPAREALPDGRAFARLASDYPAPMGYYQDFYGYGFAVKGASFTEAYVSVADALHAFGKDAVVREALDAIAFDRLVASQPQACRSFVGLFDAMARSLSWAKGSADLMILTTRWVAPGFKIGENPLVPSIPDLRYRSGPGTGGKVLGVLKAGYPLTVIEEGPKETIDGLTGAWTRFMSRNASWAPAGWAFGGYLRPMTAAEVEAMNVDW